MTFPRVPIKRVARIVGGSTPPAADDNWDGDVNWLTPTDISACHGGAVGESARKLTRVGLAACSAVIAPAGSVVVTTRAPIGNVALTTVPSATNQGCRTIIPGPRLDPRFLRYQLQVRVADLQARGTGTTFQELSGSALGMVDVSLPPLDVQRAIADFLDRELERIAALDRELADVREVAAAAMDDDLRRLVLEGNYPFVPLKYYAKPGTGHTPSREHPEYWIPEECVVPWFTLADVHQIRDGRREVVTETSEHLSEAGIANSAAVKHPAGTVLLSRTASVGFSAVMGVDMAVSQHFMTWTCGPKLDPFYLLVALRAMQPELRRLMQGSTHKTIYMPDLHALRIPLPPLDRQREIVAQARAKAAAVWPLVDETVELQRCLAEYRDALITEAVAGQLDPARVEGPEMEERMHAALEGAGAP